MSALLRYHWRSHHEERLTIPHPTDALLAVDLNGSLAVAWQQLHAAGVARIGAREALRGVRAYP